MRVADRAFPDVELHDSQNPSTQAWPVRPVIAFENSIPYAWDDDVMIWDAEDVDEFVWDIDDTLDDWLDMTCDMVGMEIRLGGIDDHLLIETGSAAITLDNSSGAWSQYNVDGTRRGLGVGSIIQIWAQNDLDAWWLFVGRVSRYDERADNTVDIEAFDVFSDLAQTIGTYTPGVAGEKSEDRLEAVLDVAEMADIPHRFDFGVVALTRQATEQSPLEEMQTVVRSDGGLLYVDSDGTLLALNRNWQAGRDDQVTVPVVSTNVCTADVVVWDALLSTNDLALADTVILENVAKLRAVETQGNVNGRYVISETDQQWTTQLEGDILAEFLLSQFSTSRLNVENFDLYLFDPDQPELWRAVDWRLFDRLRFLHDARTPTGVARLDLDVLVLSISHSITPAMWVMSIGTSRALAYVAPIVWNTELYAWNDTNPLAVWSY